jgi:hypothetical protein
MRPRFFSVPSSTLPQLRERTQTAVLSPRSFMPLITLISARNNFGIKRDIDVILDALKDVSADIQWIEIPGFSKKSRLLTMAKSLRKFRGRGDLSIFVGPIYWEWLYASRSNMIIPNSEWFLRNWIGRLKAFDCIAAKTKLTQRIFEKLHNRVVFTSFTTPDIHSPSSSHGKEKRFLHLASNPWGKGTLALLEAWESDPSLPPLTIVANRFEHPLRTKAGNVEIIERFLDRDEIVALMNRSQFHICCSVAEGFGHYILEPMTTEGIVFTNNGPSMNELIDESRGFLVDCSPDGELNLCTKYRLDPGSLKSKIKQALAMTDGERAALGANAREWYLKNDSDFKARFPELVSSLL